MSNTADMVNEYIESSKQELSEISIPKTAEVVANHIRNQIIAGGINPGEHLQPEAQLMAQFATSRPTIREAFRILETEEFISVKRGARHGAQVHRPSAKMISKYAGYVLQAHNTTLKEIYAARYAIEPVVARMLALESNPAHVKALEKQISDIEAVVASGVSNSKTLRLSFLHFHMQMVAFTENNALALLFLMLEQVLESHQMRQETPKNLANASQEELAKICKETLAVYRRLLKYIDKGDANRAAELWRKHVQEINEDWTAGFESTSVYEVMN